MDLLSSVNGSGVAQETIPDAEFSSQLDQLAEKWGDLKAKGIELRHQTGVLLNQRFGIPEKRQVRGEEVLKQAAEKLGFKESDLYRMRQFAYQFKSIEDFKQTHSEVTTWTAIKEMLPKLSNRGGQRKTQGMDGVCPLPERKAPAYRPKDMSKTLEDLSSMFKQVEINLSEQDQKDLLEKFEELVKAVECRLKIRVSLEKEPVKLQ
jgi:hypothetical protein